MKAFKNEPFTDFSNPYYRSAMARALEGVRRELGKEYPHIVNGKEITSPRKFHSLNPANHKEVIGIFQEGDETLTQRAIEAAIKAFKPWSLVSVKQKARFLFKISALMRRRKFELASWLVLEVGKTWREADAELAEAIDFCEYYGREIIHLSSPPKLVPLPQEKNKLVYIPLGVGAIITPWNFPLAILAGMTTAAIVTGNTVVLKPSEFSPATAFQFMKLVKEVGLPHGVINFLTGRGATIGRMLVRHPYIRFVSFTGSKKTGLEIHEASAKTADGQKWMKRVVAEMGGKDAIIVDRECDLDKAVEGIVKSAFGFQGQKCSACSRAIIDKKIYAPFVEKLLEKTKTLKLGSPETNTTTIGPVVSTVAFKKIERYIRIGKKEGKLLFGGKTDPSFGYFIEPTIFGGVPPDARISQEEIFGPVLSLIKANNFNHALEIANGTEYGLTGAFYTDNPKKIEKGIREFHVGNLYVNRGCTGAFVGAHPFGGFNMSGTDSKAGGPDYLLHFMQAKSISKKIT